MKEKISKAEQERITKKILEEKLRLTHTTGMSYGAKAFAQVVFDMFPENNTEIYKLSADERLALLVKIKSFVDKTLENSIQDLSQAIENTKKTYEKLQETNKKINEMKPIDFKGENT